MLPSTLTQDLRVFATRTRNRSPPPPILVQRNRQRYHHTPHLCNCHPNTHRLPSSTLTQDLRAFATRTRNCSPPILIQRNRQRYDHTPLYVLATLIRIAPHHQRSRRTDARLPLVHATARPPSSSNAIANVTTTYPLCVLATTNPQRAPPNRESTPIKNQPVQCKKM